MKIPGQSRQRTTSANVVLLMLLLILVAPPPGASATIAISVSSGTQVFESLCNGVGWLWRVGSNTTPGKWTIIVSCSKGEERGELRTAFEVR